jgi:hypothetical protein
MMYVVWIMVEWVCATSLSVILYIFLGVMRGTSLMTLIYIRSVLLIVLIIQRYFNSWHKFLMSLIISELGYMSKVLLCTCLLWPHNEGIFWNSWKMRIIHDSWKGYIILMLWVSRIFIFYMTIWMVVKFIGDISKKYMHLFHDNIRHVNIPMCCKVYIWWYLLDLSTHFSKRIDAANYACGVIFI